MRLQSKKLNQPLLPPIIAGIFFLSLVYWLYLACTTRMDIVYDAIEYQNLGKLLNTQGWIEYFKVGPCREPIYPFLVSISMHLESVTGLAYVKIMAFFGVFLLLLTQALTYIILRLLNIRNSICALTLIYLALSPCVNNSAFSLFSEIAEIPFVLCIILTSYFSWESIKKNTHLASFFYGLLLGLSLALATFVKDVFEGAAPAFLIVLFITIYSTNKKLTASFLLCLVTAVSFYAVPINAYKWLNWEYNGTFALANRASLRLYSTAAQRTEPLTIKKLAVALAYVPGEGVCNSIFGPKDCFYWSFQGADVLGDKLKLKHFRTKQLNTTVLYKAEYKILQDPFEFTLFTCVEGLKMFFWESTQIGFVQYPHWLQRIYDFKIFNNALRFLLSLLTFIAVFDLWIESFKPERSPIGFLIGVLIFFYALFFALFLLITRYMIPIVPLYLIAISMWFNKILAPKK